MCTDITSSQQALAFVKIPTKQKERIIPGLFAVIKGEGPWPKLGKTDLKSKLGEINDIEHNKGSKIYPQNQVILGIPLMHKCLSIILVWVIVSHK